MNPLEQLFPGLAGSDYRVTSPRDGDYNCIACAPGDTRNWWWPNRDVAKEYWPPGSRSSGTDVSLRAWNPHIKQGLIRLSVPLWLKATRDEQAETVIHEACHVLADYQFGARQGHGPRWRQLMVQCGYLNPLRCHTVDRANIEQRRRKRPQFPQTLDRLRAACGCPSGVLVGPVQATRVQNGKIYLCRICKQRVAIGFNEPGH